MSATQRVVVAMSGGVDSATAAALLLEAGHEVVGVTLRLHSCGPGTDGQACGGLDGVARAQAVASRLAIPHHVLDLSRAFDEEVLRPAWDEYALGRTPSPCLVCNERIKFGRLLGWARELGAWRLATGHYARLGQDRDGTPSLLRAADRGKDQSYFLAGLGAGTLGSVLFPVGGLSKREVRELAARHGLPNAATPESQDACFVGGGATCFAEALRGRYGVAARPGPIVDEAGRVVGQHAGLHLFTVGQRRGLGLRTAKRSWVVALRPETATVVVTSDERALDHELFSVRGVRWVDGIERGSPLTCRVQVRSTHASEDAVVTPLGPGRVGVACVRPVRAVTPGQAAVFFDGPRVLGRGWIDRTQGPDEPR